MWPLLSVGYAEGGRALKRTKSRESGEKHIAIYLSENIYSHRFFKLNQVFTINNQSAFCSGSLVLFAITFSARSSEQYGAE